MSQENAQDEQIAQEESEKIEVHDFKPIFARKTPKIELRNQNLPDFVLKVDACYTSKEMPIQLKKEYEDKNRVLDQSNDFD